MTPKVAARAGRLFRFGLVGGAATLSYAALALLLHWAGLSPAPTSVTAYLIAGGVSYLGHKHLTFRSDRPHVVAAPRFLASLGLGAVAAGALSEVLVEGLRLSVVASTLIVCIVAPLLSYGALSLFVFGGRLAGAADRNASCDLSHIGPDGLQGWRHPGVAARQDFAGCESLEGGKACGSPDDKAGLRSAQGVEA